MHDEPDNSPSPPPELAPYVSAFEPENIERANAKGYSISEWERLIERLGPENAVDEIDYPGNLPRALAAALLLLPGGECHELSRRNPFEFANLAGLAWEWLEKIGAPDASDVVLRLVAPEVMAAFGWMIENRTASLMKSCGLGSRLN